MFRTLSVLSAVRDIAIAIASAFPSSPPLPAPRRSFDKGLEHEATKYNQLFPPTKTHQGGL